MRVCQSVTMFIDSGKLVVTTKLYHAPCVTTQVVIQGNIPKGTNLHFKYHDFSRRLISLEKPILFGTATCAETHTLLAAEARDFHYRLASKMALLG